MIRFFALVLNESWNSTWEILFSEDVPEETPIVDFVEKLQKGISSHPLLQPFLREFPRARIIVLRKPPSQARLQRSYKMGQAYISKQEHEIEKCSARLDAMWKMLQTQEEYCMHLTKMITPEEESLPSVTLEG